MRGRPFQLACDARRRPYPFGHTFRAGLERQVAETVLRDPRLVQPLLHAQARPDNKDVSNVVTFAIVKLMMR